MKLQRKRPYAYRGKRRITWWKALAALVSDEQLSADYILPSALDKSVADTVARAVAQEAREQGIARA